MPNKLMLAVPGISITASFSSHLATRPDDYVYRNGFAGINYY